MNNLLQESMVLIAKFYTLQDAVDYIDKHQLDDAIIWQGFWGAFEVLRESTPRQ